MTNTGRGVCLSLWLPRTRSQESSSSLVKDLAVKRRVHVVANERHAAALLCRGGARVSLAASAVCTYYYFIGSRRRWCRCRCYLYVESRSRQLLAYCWLAGCSIGRRVERVSEPHHESSPTELVVSELLKTDLYTGGAANTINRTAEQRNSYSRVESSQAKSAVNLHAREIHTHYRYTRDATTMALRCLVMLHKVAINRVGFSERGEYNWSGCLPAAAAERNIYKYYRGARMDGATKLLEKTTIGGGCGASGGCWES